MVVLIDNGHGVNTAGKRSPKLEDGRQLLEYQYAREIAGRVFKELEQKGEDQSYEEVLEDIIKRDHNDMTRKLNPLRKADDAVELDTTGMDIEEVVRAVLDIVEG